MVDNAMEDSTEIRQTLGTQLPEPVSLALDTLQASARAWYQFLGNTDELRRITKNRLQNTSERDLSEVEAEAKLWLDTAESANNAAAIPTLYYFFMRVYAVERVHWQRQLNGLYDADLASIKAGIDSIRQREGLNDNKSWSIGKAPEDFEKLEDEYSQVLAAKFEGALREFGLNDIANLYCMDRESYEEFREQGRRLGFEDIPDLEQLSTLQRQFEAESKICAEGEAYHAAAIMIGSAIEAALLFTCLNRRDEALNARERLPKKKRPKNTDPKRWSLYQLTLVADQAGWLPDFEVEDGTLLSGPLLDMMRGLRNLVHPARHLSRITAGVERQYLNALAAYILLKRHLAVPRMSPTGFERDTKR